ncbi:hypothetical protein F4801DRAFT_559592 [Xylaria longipes]|nr:hypothetical protein F4801DRAFT_559592 [Xylaria longipes]
MPDREVAIMSRSLAGEYVVYHQYESVLSAESQADVSPLQASLGPSHDSASSCLCWRPFYLRRFVLLGFISVFILIVVTIEVLLAVSNRDHGLATSTSAQHYLWTYGPTAFLTGVAALWARTEYQSKLVAPWIRLSQNAAPASHTLLLDYVSQFSLFAIFRSLSKGDFTVSITLTVSIILKILIIISTSLISLSWIGRNHDSYPMLLRDGFIDSNAKLSTTGNLATYMLQGLRDQNLTLPEGISSDYSFQSVQTNLPDTSETQVTVDGLVNSLNCEPVDLTLAGATYPSPQLGLKSLNLTISSPQCNVSLANLPGVFSRNPPNNSTLFARFEQVQCDKIPGDPGKRVLVVFGNLTYYTDYSRNISVYYGKTNPTVGLLNKSTNLLCVPEYAIDRVQVIRNATQTKSVVPIPGAPRRTLESVTAWDIMEATFVAGQAHSFNQDTYGQSTNVSMVPVDVDPYMLTALISQLEPGSQAIDLFNVDVLRKTAASYYQQIGAVLAKKSLMGQTSMNTVGSATVNENRLIVRPWIAQWMAALVAVCIVLTAIALFIVPRKGFLPCSPTTFPDLVSILHQSRQLSAQLQYAGASDNNHLVQFLRRSTFQSGLAYDPMSNQNRFCVIDVDCGQDGRSNRFSQISSKLFHPAILHPACRSMLCLTVVGLIITLELLLRTSNLEEGLGDVDDDTYMHYTWTAIPALLFGVLSMAFSAVDFQIRTLAPYMSLKQYVSRGIFKQLELLDMTVPVAMYREIKLKTFWALATTTALLLASLFTTLSASLFQELSVPVTIPWMLQPSRSFRSPYLPFLTLVTSGPSTEIPSLILESNYSFPRFTYVDLAFPELTAVTMLPSTMNSSTVSVSAMIPAVRGRMDCLSLDHTQIHVNLTINDDTPPNENLFAVWIDGYGSPRNNDFRFYPTSNVTYIASSTNLVNSHADNELLYFWAKIDLGATPALQHTAALSCAVTFEALDVNTTFVGTDFDLDSRNPPQPLEHTVRNSTLSDSDLAMTIDNYDGLVIIDVDPQLLDTFFALLVTSPWAIPISALGDPSANDDVIAAIQRHHKIITAQRLAVLRVPANETNSTLARPINPGDNDAQRTINATVTDTTGRRRVVQDATSTHILVALLTTALVLFVIGWASSPSTDVLPRNPTTIASAVALLAGGNIFDRLSSNTPLLSPEETASTLGGPETQFWMGWGNMKDEEGMENGGENEGGVSRFGIFAVDKEDMHQA